MFSKARFVSWAAVLHLLLTASAHLAVAQSLIVSPSELVLRYQIGGKPVTATLSISSSGAPIPFSAAAFLQSPPGVNWLSVSPNNGTAPTTPNSLTVTVLINPAGLAAGSYFGVVSIAPSGPSLRAARAVSADPTVPVSLSVSGSNQLSVDTSALFFPPQPGGPLTPQPLLLTSATAPLYFAANATTQTGGNWLLVGPAAGTASVSGTPITVSVDTTGLTLGLTYFGQIVFVDTGGNTVTVGVALTVSSVSTIRTIAHLANGQGWKTTIILVNSGTQNANFTLNFWKDDGSALTMPLGTDGNTAAVSGTIPPGAPRILQSDGTGADLLTGWGQLSGPVSIGGTAIFTASSAGQPPSEAAVPLTSAGGTTLFVPFDITPGYATGLAFADPGTAADTVSGSFLDEFGHVVSGGGAFPAPVAAHGHFSAVLGSSALFPGIASSRGVAKFTSSAVTYGLGIRFNGTAFTSIDALANVPAGPKLMPHIANGQGWKTTVILVNTGAAAAFTLSFFGDDGSPLVLPLGTDGLASSLSGVLAAGAVRIIQSDGTGPALLTGWARLDTAGAIGGTAIFTAQSSGKPPSEAAVPITSAGNTTLFLPFDTTTGFSTGMALVNPGDVDSSYSATFVNEAGTVIASLASGTLLAHHHFSAVLGSSALMPGFPHTRGVVQFTSNTALYGLGIRANGTAFTSIRTVLPGGN